MCERQHVDVHDACASVHGAGASEKFAGAPRQAWSVIRGSRGLWFHHEWCHMIIEQRSINRDSSQCFVLKTIVFTIKSVQTHFSLQPSGLLTLSPLFYTIKYVSFFLYEGTCCVSCSLDASTFSLKSFISRRQ